MTVGKIKRWITGYDEKVGCLNNWGNCSYLYNISIIWTEFSMDLALNVFSMKCYLDYYYLEIYKLRNISFYIISQKLAQSTHLNYKTA